MQIFRLKNLTLFFHNVSKALLTRYVLVGKSFKNLLIILCIHI